MADSDEDTESTDTKLCKECNEAIDESNRLIASRGSNMKGFYKNVCKSCFRSHTLLTTRLKMQHRYPADSKCEMCKRIESKLVLDHDHVTMSFRGWLCQRCNQGFGKLGDTGQAAIQCLLYAF